MSIVMFSMSCPSHLSNGVSSCSRSLCASTFTDSCPAVAGGLWYVSSPASNPLDGSSSPCGLSSLNLDPATMTSVIARQHNDINSQPLNYDVWERRSVTALTISSSQHVCQRVEVKSTSNWQRCHHLRRCHKRMSHWIAVITSSKVTIVRCNDCIGFTLLEVITVDTHTHTHRLDVELWHLPFFSDSHTFSMY